jgi:cell division protein FtsQ
MSTAPTRLKVRPAVQAADAAADRLAARRRSVRRRRWVKTGAVAAVVALLLGAAWVVLASPWLAVHDVEVAGVHRLSAQQVEAAADVPTGRPLVRLDLGGLRDRVEALPGVESAVVTREWPQTVRISVVERVPGATRELSDGTWAVLDHTGVQLGRTTAQPTGLVEVDVDPAAVGATTVQAAVEVAAGLPKALRAKVDVVTAVSPDDVRLRLHDGDLVKWGSSEDGDLKAQVLTALLTRSARTYDVSAPLAPTTAS